MRLRAYVHGDDFVVSGKIGDLNSLRVEMEKTYALIVEALGPDEGQSEDARVLAMRRTLAMRKSF